MFLRSHLEIYERSSSHFFITIFTTNGLHSVLAMASLRSCNSIKARRVRFFIRFPRLWTGVGQFKSFKRGQHFNCQFTAHPRFTSQGVHKSIHDGTSSNSNISTSHSFKGYTSPESGPIDTIPFVGLQFEALLLRQCSATRLFSFFHHYTAL